MLPLGEIRRQHRFYLRNRENINKAKKCRAYRRESPLKVSGDMAFALLLSMARAEIIISA